MAGGISSCDRTCSIVSRTVVRGLGRRAAPVAVSARVVPDEARVEGDALMIPLRDASRTPVRFRVVTVSLIAVGLAIVGATSAMPLRAQSVDQVATVPPNVVLSNYDNVPVGPFCGLEGSAYVARVGDPSAAWFNPAGLSRQTGVQISGSAGVYQWTAVSPQ